LIQVWRRRAYAVGERNRRRAFCNAKLLPTSRVNTPSQHTGGTAWKSTGGGTPGTPLPCRTCSTHGRRCKTRGLLRGVTSHTAGTGCANLKNHDSSLRRVRDPEPRTIWLGTPRRYAPHARRIVDSGVGEFHVCGHRWIPKCRSTLWDKGGIDGRTREAQIKAGRSRKTAARKHAMPRG